MPAAVPLVAAVAGAAVSSAIGTGLIASAVGTIVATGINAIGSRALAKKPKSPQFTQEAGGRAFAVRSSVETHKLIYGEARVSGPIVFIKTVDHGVDNTSTTRSGNNKFLHLVFALAAHEVDSIGDVYLNDQRITDYDANGYIMQAPYHKPDGQSFVRIRKHLGHIHQLGDDLLITECGLSGDHRLRGLAYLYVTMMWDPDVFPNGIPNVSAIVRGKKVYDPRSGLTAWSDNAALCIRDYLTSRDGSLLNEPYGFGIPNSRIDDAYTIAAANVCDEAVTLNTGGTQKRYTCNGVIDTGSGRLDNLTQLLTALAGTVTQVGDKFRIHPASYDSPTGSLGMESVVSGVNIRTRTPRKELFNAVRGVYVDPDKGWQPTDFPLMAFGGYETQDGGERLPKDIELPFTIHPEAAQRIAKVLLEKSRQGMIVELAVMHDALKYSVFDVIELTYSTAGWVNKPFRILDWQWPDAPAGAIQLRLQEESAASYDWNRGMALAYDAAPDTSLPNAWEVASPGAMTVTEEKYVTRNGDGVKSRVILSWLASPDGFLKEYQAEYRVKDAPDWQALPRTGSTTQFIEDIAPGIYDFRVKAVSQLGVSSAYSTASKQINGLLDAPVEPQNLTISTIGGLAILRWDEYTGNDTLDVRIGGKVVFRHSPDPADGWQQSTTIGNAEPGSGVTSVLPLKPGVYLAKAVDSSGVESLAASSVTTEQATALAYANVVTLDEHPSFSGAKTDCIVVGGVLKLDANGLFDSIADIDAEPDIDGYGNVRTWGNYLFSGGIDLGSQARVRLTAHLKATIDNQLDKIDDRTTSIDDWDNFDGTGAASADAKVYVRQTNDDPSGSPAWGSWQRLDSGEFFARAFQFKVELTSTDPAYNIAISELSITADEVA